ncbi:YwdI family protein [Bacillus sp. EB600]|uniref:YwdI family protein n=1 Tax=Bacillus sp. EB600 TaxID=2806345 RepID=UPI00210D7FC6|nr:YwdI family protein [Bacillus sp. EB600]MCQ6280328.1 YwdI family protein [Bacillus sp. EB600]
MNISVQKLLTKMEDELHLAKATVKEENLREKVYSIKTLCELILDEKQLRNESTVTAAKGIIQQQSFSQPMSMTINQPKKLALDDEANGDSLLDF